MLIPVRQTRQSPWSEEFGFAKMDSEKENRDSAYRDVNTIAYVFQYSQGDYVKT